MYVDAITLAALADEWRTLLVGARLDSIIQPTEHTLAIQCYAPGSQHQNLVPGGANRWLYLSAHPQMARAHLTATKPQRIASEPPAFVMLLRKHLEGTRIEEIVQPRWERVLEIVASYRHQETHVRFRLILEIMGRMSNIVFCDEQGMILGCLRRVGPEVNRYRTIQTGTPYIPPPPQQRTVLGQTSPRLEPTTITASQLSICAAEEFAAQAEPKPATKKTKTSSQPEAWQLLTRNLLGCSPLLAREAVFRATEDSKTLLEQMDNEQWEELAWNVQDLTSVYDTHRWSPQLVERATSPSSRSAPVAFASYILEQYAALPDIQVQTPSSVNVLLDEYYARAEWRDAVDGLRAPIRKILQSQRDRCLRKADILRQEMNASEEAARYRLYGDLLLTYQKDVVQGQPEISLANYFDQSGPPPLVVVPLDPRFDAVTNANRYFHKYQKLKRALVLVPGQIEQNTVELATIEQLLTDLMLAENTAEITLVRAEVQTAGYIRGKAAIDKQAQKAAKKGKGATRGKPTLPGGGVPITVQSGDGFTLLIGKNSRQNEDVTFRQASGNDIWLHARGVAGAHVIIKAAGRQVPQATIDQAASLAAYYSEVRGNTSAPVDYTLQRHVRHMKGGGPGMVIYEREHTLYVEPDKALALLTVAR